MVFDPPENESPAAKFHYIWDNSHNLIVHKNNQYQSEASGSSMDIDVDFSYIHRRKTRWELIRLCTVVMGIEFAYAAITAYSEPILLTIGVPHNMASMVFALSPVLGFFLSGFIGSLSDRCMLTYGRRRIFIWGHAFFVVISLLYLPYGTGNCRSTTSINSINLNYGTNNSTPPTSIYSTNLRLQLNDNNSYDMGTTVAPASSQEEEEFVDETTTVAPASSPSVTAVSKVIYVLIIAAIVLADYNTDGLQNPTRAYLLDVCNEDDHTRGLTMFPVLAGLGGSVGYFLASVKWDQFYIGQLMGGNLKTLFYLTAFIFVVCLLITVTTFGEIPLALLFRMRSKSLQGDSISVENIGINYIRADIDLDIISCEGTSDGKSLSSVPGSRPRSQSRHGSTLGLASLLEKEKAPTWCEYICSIIYLPYSLQILLITNVLCWGSHVSYALFFTDYVGQQIYGGKPQAPRESPLREKYEEGVRYACLGMMIMAFTCLIYSSLLERVIKRLGLRAVYIINISIDALGTLAMYYFNTKWAVLIFSSSCGILYCTVMTIPYIIIAHYHTLNVFQVDQQGEQVISKQVRGLGTDVSIIGTAVFIAQLFISLGMGHLVEFFSSTSVVPLACGICSFLAAVAATQVMYLDL